MKAKITVRNILFLVLSVIVLCSVMCLSVSAFEGTYDCPHDLGDDGWEILVTPNCVEGGTKSKWCKDCSDYSLKYIDKDDTAHTPGLWTVIEENSCQKPGIEAIFCTKCKVYEFERRVIPAHDYKVVYSEEPTCSKTGYELIVCMTCYDMRTKTIDIDPDAHIFTEQILVEATCVEESGLKRITCLCKDENGKQCEYSEKVPYSDSDNHIENDWSGSDVGKEPATCSAPGYYYKDCSGCENEIRKEIPQHSETKVADVISTIAPTCSTGGVEKRKCSCGAIYDYELPIEADNHVYSIWFTEKEAGCTAGKKYKYCKYHRDVRIEETIPANGQHSFTEWECVIEPDCSKTGLEQRECTECKKVKETRELPVKHNFTTWEVKAVMSCDESNPVQGVELAKCNDCTFEKHFTIPVLHNYGSWVLVTASNCKDQNVGKRERKCSGCGNVESETYVEEHKFTDWYVTVKPTCAVDGKSGIEGRRTRWCESCKIYEHETVPAAHEYVDVEITKYPVCSQNGMVEDGMKSVECIYCGKTEDVVIDGAHNFTEWTVVSEPTCDADKQQLVAGSESRCCVACGFEEIREIAGVHTYGNWYWSKANGEKCGSENGTFVLHRECQKCNLSDKKTVSKINHPNLKTIAVSPTCASSGYTMELCPDCDYSAVVKNSIVPANGHKLAENWSNGVTATCTTKGSRYKACENCDYIKYEYIDRTEHVVMVLEPTVEPTCIKEGLKGRSYCAVCQEVFESSVIPALGHDRPEGSETCKRCGAYEGSKDCSCACHSKTGMENIFFKLINKFYQFFGINQICKCGDLHYTEFGFFAKLLGKG